MLELAWVIPAITFVSFWVILLLGKRMPKGGAEVGVGALVVCMALSSVAAFQWISRDATLEVSHGGGHAAEESSGGHAAEESSGSHAEEEGGHEAAAATEEAGGHGDEAAATEEEGGHAEEAEKIRAPVVEETTWFEIGDLKVDVGIHIDGFA